MVGGRQFQLRIHRTPQSTASLLIKLKRSHTYKYSEHYSGNGTSDEPLPSFLWRQLDEWRSTKEEAKHVSHDVITDDHGHWNQKPTNTHITNIILFTD